MSFHGVYCSFSLLTVWTGNHPSSHGSIIHIKREHTSRAFCFSFCQCLKNCKTRRAKDCVSRLFLRKYMILKQPYIFRTSLTPCVLAPYCIHDICFVPNWAMGWIKWCYSSSDAVFNMDESFPQAIKIQAFNFFLGDKPCHRIDVHTNCSAT